MLRNVVEFLTNIRSAETGAERRVGAHETEPCCGSTAGSAETSASWSSEPVELSSNQCGGRPGLLELRACGVVIQSVWGSPRAAGADEHKGGSKTTETHFLTGRRPEVQDKVSRGPAPSEGPCGAYFSPLPALAASPQPLPLSPHGPLRRL